MVAAPGLVQPRSAADDAALRPLRVEARSARRQVPARHSVRAASRSAPRVCREAAHRAPMAVARSGERRKDQPEFVAQPELVARPMVARPVMVVLSRQAAEAQPVARCAAEVGQEVRHSAEARPLAEPVAVRPKGLDAAVAAVRPEAPNAAAAAAEEVAAVSAAAGVLPPEGVAELDEAVPLPVVVAPAEAGAEEARRPAARDAEVVPQPEVRGEAVVAVRRAALAWAFRPDRVLPWPGPPQAARSARAMQARSTASP